MRWLPSAAFLTALAASSPAQDLASPGFELRSAPFPSASAFAATTTLANGEIIVFDGTRVTQHDAAGGLLRELGSLPAFVYPSFVLVDPAEQALYFGESSSGGIHRLFVGVSSSPDAVAVLPFNYDAAMRDGDELFVSAASCGLTCGNEIWRIDLATFEPTLVARVPGASGPLAFDAAGNLYYGFASADFPPPPKPSTLYRWSVAQLAQGTLLDLTDASPVGGGFVGAARLAYDGRSGSLYLMENNFLSGENRIRRVLGAADQSPVVVEGQPFRSMNSLVLHPGEGPALFRAFQPAEGGFLTYTTGDFVAPPERLELRPERPLLTLSGPGTSGPGPIDVALDGGPPLGFARLFYCPRSLAHPVEQSLVIAGLPLFLGLHLPALGSVPGLLPLDSAGDLQQSLLNPGGLQGQLALQLLLLDAQSRLAGTSSLALL